MHQPKAQEYIPAPQYPPVPLFFKRLLRMWGSALWDLENKPGTSFGEQQDWGAWRTVQAPRETPCKAGLVCHMLWLEQSPALQLIGAIGTCKHSWQQCLSQRPRSHVWT